MSAPLVSIVVPTWNRAGSLMRCLHSLSSQAYPLERAEIVVVDDGSESPPEPAAVEAAAGGRPVRLVLAAHGGAGAARARGIAEVRGDIVAFVDDDCTVPPDYLSAVETAFEDDAIEVVQVALENPEPGNLYGRAWERVWKMSVDAYSERRGDGRVEIRMLGGVMAARRRLFDRVRFDAGLAAREDLDLRLQIEALGVPIFYEPRIRVFNHCRRTLGEYLRQQMWYGRNQARLTRKWGALHDAGAVNPTSVRAFRAAVRDEGLWSGLAINGVLRLKRYAGVVGVLRQEAADRSRGQRWRYHAALSRSAMVWCVRHGGRGVKRALRWLARPATTPAVPAPTPVVFRSAAPAGGVSDGQVPLRPVAVMIDNSRGAHPQLGLAEASMVIEAPVEGGLTRLMAVYVDRLPSLAGPVRSARPYFMDWAGAFQPFYVHCSASPEARRLLQQPEHLIGIDLLYEKRQDGSLQLVQNAEACRLDERRSPPHHVFARPDVIHGSIERLRMALPSGVTVDSAVDLKRFRAELALAVGVADGISAPAGRVTIRSRPGAAMSSVFEWDAAAGEFVRWVHLDGRRIDAAAPVAVANLVVLRTKAGPLPGDLRGRIGVAALGHGPATVWRAGGAEDALWRMTAPVGPLEIQRADGTPLPFVPGLTWIVVLGEEGRASQTRPR